jgi:hypothetical protein
VLGDSTISMIAAASLSFVLFDSPVEKHTGPWSENNRAGRLTGAVLIPRSVSSLVYSGGRACSVTSDEIASSWTLFAGYGFEPAGKSPLD